MKYRILTAILLLLFLAFTLSAAPAKPKAKQKNVPDPVRILADAREALDKYDFDKASELMESYPEPLDSVAAWISHASEMGQQMLERVEDVVVFDSLVVDKETFFKSYRLSDAAGSLTSSANVSGLNSPVYTTHNGLTRLFAVKDDKEATSIGSARVLADGSIDNTRVYPNADGIDDAAFPFLMPDGLTLYFSGMGEMSLGGYDIFITRRGGVDDDFLQPQNLGMPFNSPYDDYMLAIDEATGIGWWATDRNRIPGKVTIYMFIPKELRTNVDTDSHDLAQRAKLESIKATQPQGFVKPSVDQLLRQANVSVPTVDFEFAMPDGTVVTSLKDVRNKRTRELLEEWLESKKDYEYDSVRLAELRLRYGKGEKKLGKEIADMEKSLETEASRIANLVNEIVRSY